MKKFTAITLLITLALGLCACTNQEAKIEESNLQSNQEVEPIKDTSQDVESVELWEIDWEVLRGPNDLVVESPLMGEQILCYNENRCIIMDTYEMSIWLVDNSGEFRCISGNQKVIDYTVAYDTLYWFNLEKEVWAFSWEEEETAKLFCEDAIAVSPFTDECEGAIVEPERANIDYGYGGLPIYSPYGL